MILYAGYDVTTLQLLVLILGNSALRSIGGSSSGPADLLIFNLLHPIHLALIIRFLISGYCTCIWGSGVLFRGRVELLP